MTATTSVGKVNQVQQEPLPERSSASRESLSSLFFTTQQSIQEYKGEDLNQKILRVYKEGKESLPNTFLKILRDLPNLSDRDAAASSQQSSLESFDQRLLALEFSLSEDQHQSEIRKFFVAYAHLYLRGSSVKDIEEIKVWISSSENQKILLIIRQAINKLPEGDAKQQLLAALEDRRKEISAPSQEGTSAAQAPEEDPRPAQAFSSWKTTATRIALTAQGLAPLAACFAINYACSDPEERSLSMAPRAVCNAIITEVVVSLIKRPLDRAITGASSWLSEKISSLIGQRMGVSQERVSKIAEPIIRTTVTLGAELGTRFAVIKTIRFVESRYLAAPSPTAGKGPNTTESPSQTSPTQKTPSTTAPQNTTTASTQPSANRTQTTTTAAPAQPPMESTQTTPTPLQNHVETSQPKTEATPPPQPTSPQNRGQRSFFGRVGTYLFANNMQEGIEEDLAIERQVAQFMGR